MSRRPRWTVIRVEWRGWTVAVAQHTTTGEIAKVYHRLGRWRRYDKQDSAVTDKALVAAAKKAIESADPKELNREFRERAVTQIQKVTTNRRKRRR